MSDGMMVAGAAGGVAGATLSTEGNRRPHVLLVAKRDGLAVEVPLSSGAAERLGKAMFLMAERLKNHETQFEMQFPPEEQP